MREGLGDGEDDDQDRAGDGDGAEDQQEVAAADVAPPLLVEPEGGEDDQLADDDEADRLREEHLVAVRPAVRFVEEAQLEGEEVGQRDEHRVGRHLQHPVAVDGVVQPAHRAASLGPGAATADRPYDVPLDARLLLLASITDKVVEPIVDVATEFIGSAGVARASSC